MDNGLQQLSIDSWQLTMKRQISRLLFLKAFSLTVSIAYCLLPWSSLLQFQIALTPSALTPFILAVSIAYWGVAPNPTSFFVLTQKRGKKGQDVARFARKIDVRKAQIVQLVEVRWSFYKGERAWHELQLRTGTIFNRLPRLFFGSSAEVEWRGIHKKWSMNRFFHAFYSGQLTIDSRLLLPIAYRGFRLP